MLWVDQAGQTGSPPGRALYLSPFLVTGSRTFDNMVNLVKKRAEARGSWSVLVANKGRAAIERPHTCQLWSLPTFQEGLPSRKAELNLPKSDLIQVFRKSQRT